MPEITASLPANLRYYRLRAGYTQVKMAEMLGLKQSGYSSWETGDVKIPSYALQTLAFLLNCTVDQLLEERKEETE